MNLARNSFYALLAQVAPLLVAVVTVPLFIGQIGPERYGALAIAWLLLGYFGTADFGIGRAITQRISSMVGETPAVRAGAVWSALVSMLAFSGLSAVLMYLFAVWYFSGPFVVEEGLRDEMVAAVMVLAFCNPVVAVSGVLAGALMGLERFRLVSMSNMVARSLLMLFPLATAYFVTLDLTALILASLSARLLGGLMLTSAVWRTFLRGHKLAFSRSEFSRLASFGAWIMVSSLIGPIMVYADRFLIGAVQDAVALAAYVIPYDMANRTLLLSAAITQALFPRFAAESPEASRERCRDFVVFIAQLLTPFIVLLVCLADPLLTLWLGNSLDPRSALVGQLILVGCWANAIANVPHAFIQARGNPQFAAMLHLVELPVYCALLFGLGQQFGLAGIAAAFSLRCMIDCTALGVKAGLMGRDTLSRLAVSLLFVLVALGASTATDNWAVLLAIALALSGAAAAMALWLIPPQIGARLATLPFARMVPGLRR